MNLGRPKIWDRKSILAAVRRVFADGATTSTAYAQYLLDHPDHQGVPSMKTVLRQFGSWKDVRGMLALNTDAQRALARARTTATAQEQVRLYWIVRDRSLDVRPATALACGGER